MKLYVLNEAYSDDDGNFGSNIHSSHLNKEDAIKELKKFHDETLEYFNDPCDEYDDEDPYYFDIYESDDIEIRNMCCIEEIEIET